MQKFLRTLLLVAALMVPWATQAQSNLSNYGLTVSSTTFSSIASTGSQLSFTSTDDGYATLTLPFGLAYGESFLAEGSTIALSANGFMYLGAASTSGTTGSHSSANYRAVTAIMQADAHIGRYSSDSDPSGVYWAYNATAGTLTIEYHRLGTYSSPYGEYTFQYVFHTNGDIDFIYGLCDKGTTNSRTLATYLTDGPENDRLYVVGDWDAPTTSTSYSARPHAVMPESGLKYTFTRPIVTCPRPLQVELANATATSLNVTWLAAGEETSWKVYLNDALQGTANTAAYTFSGLTPNTEYTVGVVAVCSTDDESTMRSATFRTPCVDLTTLPYVQDFEEAATGTSTSASFVDCMARLNNGSQYFGYPYVSSNSNYNHTAEGTQGLYWFNSTTTGTYGDYQYVVLPGIDPSVASVNNLWLRFWAKTTSTSYNPVFEVGVMTVQGDPASFVKVADVNVSGTEWAEYITLLTPYTGSGKYVAIRALRPQSGWYAVVDDITLEETPACLPVVNVAANATVGAATITWDFFPGSEAPAGYEVNYKLAGAAGEGTTIATTTTSVILSGLTAETEYEVKVRATCGADGNSAWSDAITFSTAALGCLEFDLSATATLQVGDGSTTTNYFPNYNYYDYSYTQQIFTATELDGAGVIQAIAVKPTNVNAASRNIEIWLGHVSDATATTFLNPSDLTLVYDGTTNYVANEWCTFAFSNQFSYNGTANLLVVVYDKTGSWVTSNTFSAHSVPSNTSRYAYRDNNPYTVGTPGTAGTGSSSRCDMVFTKSPCSQQAVCAAPVVSLTAIDETTATLEWMPGYDETAWEIVYREAGTEDWTVAATGVTALTYTVTGLTPATDYEFGARFVCSDNATFIGTAEGHTTCTSVDLPYAYGFGQSAGMYCWSFIGDDVNNPLMLGVDDEGRTLLRFSSYNNSSDYNQYLVSPEFSSTEPIKVTLGHMAQSEGDSLQVLYSTTTADISAMTAATEMMSSTEYSLDSLYLPAETKYIALHYFGQYAYYYYIDSIYIGVNPQHTVTVNVVNQEGNDEVWGTVTPTSATVYENDGIAFSATAGEYKRVAAWYGGTNLEVAPLATDVEEFEIEHVMSDTIITVFFGYGQFQVKALPNYEEMGAVTSNGVYDNYMFDYNTEAILTATPNYGFDFVEWLDADGNSFSTDNPLTVLAVQNYDLTARFVIGNFTLTDNSVNGHIDGITEDGVNTKSYTYGSLATLTAVADEHYHFNGWSDEYAGGETRTYRVIKDSAFAALFAADVYTVAIDGPAIATYTGAGEYDYLDEVTVTVSDIDEHYTFNGWTLQTNEYREVFYFFENNDMYEGAPVYGYSVDGETITHYYTYNWSTYNMDPTDPFEVPSDANIYSGNWYFSETDTLSTETSYTFTAEANVTLVPVFTALQYTLTIATSDADMGTVSFTDYEGTSVTVDYLTQVEIRADAVQGAYSGFAGWSDGSSDRVRTVTVTDDSTITANFAFNTFDLSYSIYPAQAEEEGASVTPSTDAPAFASSLTITANPTEHWLFDHWEDAYGNVLGTDLTYTEPNVFEDVYYAAYFVRDQHTAVATTGTDALDNAYGTIAIYDANWEPATVFTHGDLAIFEFTPSYGYTFAYWTDANGNEYTYNPIGFNAEEDIELTAHVNPIPYDVDVYVYQEAGESFLRGDASITTTPVDYLTAAAPTYEESVYGYVFDYWANEDGEEVTDFTVLGPTTFVAHFKKDLFTVTGTVAADFSMMGYVTGSAEVEYLDEVTLTANENYGYTFVRWVDENGAEYSTDQEITVVADEDKTFYAEYDYLTFPVTVHIVPTGMGTVDGYNMAMVDDAFFGQVPYSMTHTLTATAIDHWHFVNWTNADGEELETNAAYSYIISGDNNFFANFAIDQHNVEIDVDDEYITDVTGSGAYDYGTYVTVNVTPAYGYNFIAWTVNDVEVSTDAEYTFRLEEDVTLVPTFEAQQFTITAVSADETLGTVSPATTTDDYKNEVELTATAAYGYDFVKWTNEDGDEFTDNPLTVTITKDETYTASFSIHQFTVTIASDDEEMGTVAFNEGPAVADLTVADGGNTNGYVPVYGYYADAYLRSQFVYPASMLAAMNGGNISQMAFYANQANVNWGTNHEVRILEIADETVSAFQDMTDATDVFTGSLSIADNQMVVAFDAPYTYNGGNLLVEIIQTNTGSYITSTWQGTNASGASVQGYSYTSLDAISATQRNFLPKATFSYELPATGPSPITYDHANGTALANYQAHIGMTATPNYGYHFTEWSNSETTESIEFDVTEDVDLVASFAKNSYTAYTAVNDPMLGSVTDDVTAEYLDEVTLTATVTDPVHYQFVNWTNADGDILGTETTLTFAIEQDTNIIANFGPQQFTVTAVSADEEMGGVYVEDPSAAPALEVTVAEEATSSSNKTPIYFYYTDVYTRTQTLYTVDDLGDLPAGSNITSMKFYTNETGVTAKNVNFQVKIAETDVDALGTAFEDLTAVSTVFEGVIDPAPEITIDFNTPFAYNGGNLIVEFVNTNAPGWRNVSFVGEDKTGASIYRSNGSSTPALSPATAANFLPKATFSYVMAGTVPAYATHEGTVDYLNDVNLYATPNAHYHFVNWTTGADVEVTTDPTFTHTVEKDTTFTANFAPDMMDITYDVNSIVRGSVEGPATGLYNTEVSATAIAAHGYEFNHWEDAEGNNVGEDATLTFTVAADNYYKAVFDFETFNLNVNVTGGTVTATQNTTTQFSGVTTIDTNYYYGAQVTLTAVNDAHYTNWKGWSDGIMVYNRTVTILDDVELTAQFDIDTHAVVIAVNDETMGAVTGATSGNYTYGTELTLTAEPAEHYHFVNWSNGATDAEITVTVENDMTLTANFAQNVYTVAAEADAAEGTAEVSATSVAPLTDVVFTATANDGYTFANWVDAEGNEVSTDNPATINITSDLTLYARFTHDVYTITVSTPIVEMGTATASATEAFYGDEVTFTATPEYGYHFVNWNGDDNLTEAEYTVTITGNTNMVANFYYNDYTINAVSADATRGTVTGDGVYSYGNIVTLTATALEGYTFKQWVDQDGEVYTNAIVNVLVDNDKSYTAYFITEGEFTVVANAEHGTVEGTGAYEEGETAVLTVTADYGYTFAGWADGDMNNPRSIVVTMDTTLTALFTTNDYTVTVTADATMGTATGSGSYAYGTNATLTATANDHYHFVMWSDGVITNPRTLNVTADVEVEALFAIDEFTVNATVINGTVAGTGTYAYGESVTLTASATGIAACNSFGGWYNGTTQVSASNEYTFTVTEDVTFSAAYTALSFTGAVTESICAGTTYSWNGYNCTAAGTYTYQTTTAAGCDSTVTLTLTVNQPVNTTESMVACSSYTWPASGETYTASNTYTTSITDANGCAATATLNLTILQPANTTETAVACDTYTWNGYTAVTSGTLTHNFTDANGCAATATLNLTINQSTTSSLTEVACESYTWDATDGNGATYTTAGTYTYTTTNAAGCDHVATLNLTINQPVYTTLNVTASDSYTWHGTTYTESGSYTYTTTAANGCDSIVTLYLTITTTVINNYTVTLAANDATMGSVNNGGTFAEGSTFAAVATANAGYHFVEWVDASNATVSTDNPYTFTVNADVTLTAVFAADPVVTYTVTLASNNTDWGTVSAGATVEAGSSFTATATANNGYHFVAWMNSNVVVSTSATYTFDVVADITLTAVFEADPLPIYTVTVIYDETMGTVTGAGEYEEGSLVTLTATPKTGYRFVSWSTGDTESFINFTITSDMTITATFELVGIDDVDMENVTIYTADSRIFVKGAEGKQVVLYDVNGRAISREANAAETVEFRVNASGVYLVKVNNAPAKRVVVVR